MKDFRSLLPGLCLAIFLILPASPWAVAQTAGTHLTGSLQTDLRLLASELPATPALLITDAEEPAPKSPWLAGALSVVLPGAGQIYAEAPWWRTALYGVVEALGWSMYLVYQNRGERATEEFEEFADRHWDVVRYVRWIETNYVGWGEEAVDREKAAEALAAIYRSNDVSLPPWERIDFAELNKLEKAVRGGFSHTLPHHGDQQYYEEIGKYAQYRAGWNDHLFDADTALYAPEFTSRKNLDYVGLREQANNYLGVASWGIGALLANHLVSMVDAALEARGYNVRLGSHLRAIERPDGSIEPAGELELRFGF